MFDSLRPHGSSSPGFPVHHQLLELALTHVKSVMPSNHLILCHSLLPLPSIFPSIRVFSMSQFFASGGQSIGASASAPVLPVNIQGWFPLGWTGLFPCSPMDSQESSSTPQFESISSLALSFLYGPTLTSGRDYWKNHSFNYVDLCRQSDVSAF